MNAPTQLIRQNRLANLLVETSLNAVLLTNEVGNIVIANQSARDWFGYTEKELAGKSIDLLFDPKPGCAASTQTARQWAQMNGSDTHVAQERMARRKDNATFPVQLNLHPLKLDGDVALLATIVDQSPTTSLADRSIAEERMAAVLETVSGLAHESRNAMQRAQSCLDLLDLDVPRDSEASRLTDGIRDALADLHRSYEDVKNYAQPIVLKRVATDPAAVIQDAFDSAIESKHRPNVELRLHRDDDLQDVAMDAQAMGRVFQNVFDNALDANEADDPIHCRCERKDNSFVTISIRDHGDGMDEQATQRSFESFFTTKQRGTGLGLAVCRRIVDAHDGEMTAANHPGGGVEVRITLPISPKVGHGETNPSESVQ